MRTVWGVVMEASDLRAVMVVLQVVIGLSIVVGGVILLAVGCDRRSRFIHRVLVVGLVIWGAWFAYIGWRGLHDSPPALAMGACVAFVVLCNGRQIRGILDGEPWWPPHSVDPASSSERGR